MWHELPTATSLADNSMALSQESSYESGSPIDLPTAGTSLQAFWPTKTELLLLPGSNKVLLTVQCLLMYTVFQDTFKRICVTLL